MDSIILVLERSDSLQRTMNGTQKCPNFQGLRHGRNTNGSLAAAVWFIPFTKGSITTLCGFLMQEVLFPPLSDYQNQVPKDGEYNDADEKKVLLKEVDALRFLLYHSCLKMSSCRAAFQSTESSPKCYPNNANNIANTRGGSKTNKQEEVGLAKRVLRWNHQQL